MSSWYFKVSKFCENSLAMRENIISIIRRCKRAGPRIEKLNCASWLAKVEIARELNEINFAV